MINYFKRFSYIKLRNKVWLAFMLLSIMQVLLIGVVVFLFNSKIIVDNEKAHLEQLINAVNQDLESRIEAFNSDALHIVIREEIKQNLNLVSALEIGKAKREITAYLNGKIITTSGYLDISIIDMNGNSYSSRATYYLPVDFDIQETEVFKKAQEYNGGLVWLSHNDLNELYAKDSILTKSLGGFSGAAVIKDYASNEIKGLLVVVIKDNYFDHMEYSKEEINDVLFYLVSPDKSVIIPMNSDSIALGEDVLSEIDTDLKRNSFTATSTKHRDEYLVSHIRNEALGWQLVSIKSSSDLRATFYQTVTILLITLLASLVACFFLASRISGYITKGIKVLADKMKRVGRGDFNTRVNTGRVDEIGELSNVFDAMVENTNLLIKQKYEQELMTKDAEFKALQAQINPHFLHNTLDMINWRLIEKGEEEVSQSIVALGNLLRYSAESGSPQASLKEEIDNISDYLYLRHANSKNLFEYEIRIDEADGIILPKLTLQPIVENAIVHGFAGRKNGNIIKIIGRKKLGQYIIEIIDNGIGMTQEQMNNLEWNLYQSSDKKTHIGLKNVEQRISHMYAESEFYIESEFGKGTSIRIVIPRNGNDYDEDCNN